jgi:uncharacterized membrane-anchored protein
MRFEIRLIWIVLGLVLSVPAYMIVAKERIIAQGTTVLLELAPRDPRSLIQGDYISLNYELSDTLLQKIKEESLSGRVVVRLDERAVARFARLHNGSLPLGKGEYLLRIRKRGSVVRIATDAFFFQEGHANVYTSARYGELKVGPSGDAVLVGLRDEEFTEITPPVSN